MDKENLSYPAVPGTFFCLYMGTAADGFLKDSIRCSQNFLSFIFYGSVTKAPLGRTQWRLPYSIFKHRTATRACPSIVQVKRVKSHSVFSISSTAVASSISTATTL